MLRILSGRNRHQFFTHKTVRRNNGLGILRNFRAFFQFQSHFYAVFTGRYGFHLADVDAYVAHGITGL